MSNWINEVIGEMYAREEDAEVREVENVPITLRVRADYVQMLQALSDRFKESRAGLSAELLQAAIDQAFSQLKPEDRDELAAKADKAYVAFCEDKYTTFEQIGLGHWGGMAVAYNMRKEGK